MGCLKQNLEPLWNEFHRRRNNKIETPSGEGLKRFLEAKIMGLETTYENENLNGSNAATKADFSTPQKGFQSVFLKKFLLLGVIIRESG